MMSLFLSVVPCSFLSDKDIDPMGKLHVVYIPVVTMHGRIGVRGIVNWNVLRIEMCRVSGGINISVTIVTFILAKYKNITRYLSDVLEI